MKTKKILLVLVSAILTLSLFSCEEEDQLGNHQHDIDPSKRPTVSAPQEISNKGFFLQVKSAAATSEYEIWEEGFAISTSPITDISKATRVIVNSNEDNELKSFLNGLDQNTPYYVRSYALNKHGLRMSNEVLMTTIPAQWVDSGIANLVESDQDWSVIDVDGNAGGGAGVVVWDAGMWDVDDDVVPFGAIGSFAIRVESNHLFVSPEIDLTNASFIADVISWDYYVDGTTTYDVLVSESLITAENYTSAEVIGTFSYGTEKKDKEEISIPDKYLGKKIYVAFRHYGNLSVFLMSKFYAKAIESLE